MFNSNIYFTFHAVRFAAVFALAGKNIVILLATLSANLDYVFFIRLCPFFKNFLLLLLFPAAFHTCQPTAFTCGNGRCVPYHYRCDHYNDCGDNSDEAGCLFRTCDSHTEFTCNNGRCISLQYVCNGVNNCYDNGTSDERNCRKFILIT